MVRVSIQGAAGGHQKTKGGVVQPGMWDQDQEQTQLERTRRALGHGRMAGRKNAKCQPARSGIGEVVSEEKKETNMNLNCLDFLCDPRTRQTATGKRRRKLACRVEAETWTGITWARRQKNRTEETPKTGE